MSDGAHETRELLRGAHTWAHRCAALDGGRAEWLACAPMWLVGASYVCAQCKLRGVSPRCPQCAGEARGVTGELAADTELARAWSAHPAFAKGYSLGSPLALRYLRVLLCVSAAFGVSAGLAPIIGPAQHEGRLPTLLELGLGLVVAVVSFPFTTAFMALYFFVIAHVVRVFGMVAEVIAPMTPVGGVRFSLVAKIFRWISRPALLQIEHVRFAFDESRAQRMELAEPLTVHLVRDGFGFVERFDAFLARPMVLRGPGGEVGPMAFEHGAIEFAPAAGTRAQGAPEPPAWARAPGREGVRLTREFPAGARVLVEGWPGYALVRVG